MTFIPLMPDTIYKEMVDKIKLRSNTPDFPFFIKPLDTITHGIPKGEITVIAARTSEGKTSLCTGIALKNAGNNKNVVYITREDNKYKVLERMCCNLFSINNRDLREGQVALLESRNPCNILKHLELCIADDYGGTFEQVSDLIKNYEPTPDIVFIDYIQLIRSVSKDQSRRAVVEEFVRNCKDTCNTTGVAIVLVSQINRTATNCKPQLWQLKDAGAIEESADLVLLLHYPWKYDIISGKESDHPNNMIEIVIAKQKDGELGMVKCRFTGKYYRFEEWDSIDEIVTKGGVT